MSIKLLQKIEELAPYFIEQDKRAKAQDKLIKSQTKAMQAYGDRLKALEERLR